MELNTNEIAAKTIANLAESFAKHLCAKAKDYFKDMGNEIAIDFGNVYTEYLSRTSQEYAKIKTLLYRHEPRNIYSFYECVGLRLGSKTIDAASVSNVLSYGNRIIISGTGGIGKSVMLKHFFLNCVKTENCIPVLIELRGLNNYEYKENGLVEYIYSCLCTHSFTLERKYFEYSLEAGKYLFLMDGFDEIRSGLSEQVEKDLLDFCSKYSENYYIVSSRPQNHFVGWSSFCELAALSLSKKQALSLVHKLEYDEQIKSKFSYELENGLFKKYRSFASNPLLLTIMLITYENSISIPGSLNDFFEQAFTALFHTHDATKGAFKRDIRSGLCYEDFKKIFSYFCFKSFFRSDYEFSENELVDYINRAREMNPVKSVFDSLAYIEDLTDSVCMLIHEGLKYRYSHRSFQEYFAALYATQLSDEKQQKLIVAWIREMRSTIHTSSFLQMLADLQRDRFNANILLPMLEDLRNLYTRTGHDVFAVFKEISCEIIITRTNDKSDFQVGVDVTNHYYHTAIDLACRNFGFHKAAEDIAILKAAKKRLFSEFCKETGIYECRFSFDQACDLGLSEQAIICIKWMTDQILFSINCIEAFNLGAPMLKRKFDSVLEEL